MTRVQGRNFRQVSTDILVWTRYQSSPRLPIQRAERPVARKKGCAPMRIVIADDHELVRRGVCSILESRKDFRVCGEASNGADAVQKTLELHPDLVILDVTMPVLDGFAAARQIAKSLPDLPVLMLSMHDGKEMVRASKSVGAHGFVTKAEVSSTLLMAVDTLLQGGMYFSDPLPNVK